MRLFAAIVPPPVCLDHLAGALTMLAVPHTVLPRGWSPRENWHVTVAFYGEVADGTAAALANRWPALRCGVSPFECELAGAGMFAHRTAWIGARLDENAWRRLARSLAPQEVGLPSFDDPAPRNRPHLTIARSADIADAIAALSVYRGPAWTVDEVTLFSSALGQGAGGHPRYEALASLPLMPDS
jgi:2'-5' RNA ligase